MSKAKSAILLLGARAVLLRERLLKALRDQRGQSEWVATAIKVGLGLFAAGIVYGLVSGPIKDLFTNAGSQISGLPGSNGLP